MVAFIYSMAELPDFNNDPWDYVIVHELLHFSVPNHGKLWRSLIRAHLGESEEVEKRLKEADGDRS